MGRFDATACCRELGAELRKRREPTGKSATDLAHELGWWPAKVSRMESGNINADQIDVIFYLGACGVYLAEAKEIMDLCRVAEHDHGYWLKAYGRYKEDSLRSLIFHATTASRSISYEPDLGPRLLPTKAYTRAVVRQE